MRGTLIGLSLVAAAIVAVGVFYQPESPMTTVRDPEPRVVEVVVEPDDRDGMQSAIGQLIFRQDPRTTGVSPDTIHFRFTEPVDVYGVLVSVDVHGLEIVEFAVGLNEPVAYATTGEWLIHTSSTGDSIDEHVWFPVPYEVGPDDYLNVGAWLYNGSEVEQSASPEVIVYFTSRPGA